MLVELMNDGIEAKHSSKSQEWYTPAPVIESARKVMGSIDLDPASSHFANQNVKADNWWTKEEDGLTRDWYGNVFCNPPGGKIGGKSLAKLFWQKLMRSPNVKQAIFLAFSIELLQTSQLSEDPDACQYVVCIPKRRLAFTDATGRVVTGNTHASAIVYVSNNDNFQRKHLANVRFAEEFNQYGSILKPFK